MGALAQPRLVRCSISATCSALRAASRCVLSEAKRITAAEDLGSAMAAATLSRYGGLLRPYAPAGVRGARAPVRRARLPVHRASARRSSDFRNVIRRSELRAGGSLLLLDEASRRLFPSSRSWECATWSPAQERTPRLGGLRTSQYVRAPEPRAQVAYRRGGVGSGSTEREVPVTRLAHHRLIYETPHLRRKLTRRGAFLLQALRGRSRGSRGRQRPAGNTGRGAASAACRARGRVAVPGGFRGRRLGPLLP